MNQVKVYFDNIIGELFPDVRSYDVAVLEHGEGVSCSTYLNYSQYVSGVEWRLVNDVDFKAAFDNSYDKVQAEFEADYEGDEDEREESLMYWMDEAYLTLGFKFWLENRQWCLECYLELDGEDGRFSRKFSWPYDLDAALKLAESELKDFFNNY